MLIDSHAHVFKKFYKNINEVIENAKKENIGKVINCSDSVRLSKENIVLCKNYVGFLYPAIGIHPENVPNNIEKDIKKLEKLVKRSKICAIGEIGLDYHYDNIDKEKQKKLFVLQLELAKKYKLPVIIHMRDSIQDTLNILKNYHLKGVIHAFSSSKEVANKIIKLGYFVGIGGVLTFKNSNLKEVIKNVDIDKIILETDSPFLSPFRGSVNEPKNVIEVAKFLAKIKNISLNEVEKITTNNVLSLFDLDN